MGFRASRDCLNQVLRSLQKEYVLYAPKLLVGGGRFSDTDCVRYAPITDIDEVEFAQKAAYSFKEVLMPIAQTLFFFTEDAVKEADGPQTEAIIFLRSCDLHAMKRLDDMYLHNGPEDYYYKRLRDKVHFVLMGCSEAYDSCFCVDMGTNISTDYDASIDVTADGYVLDCKWEVLETLLRDSGAKAQAVTPAHVTETQTRVHIPKHLDNRIASSTLWDEYNTRCIACGRCNFVCPTCTCYTMQDLFYTDNGKVGERRRVWASCMVDGFTDVAGGGSYRKKNGERMRFKVLHKVLNHEARFGHPMCVGCGRCDDICPEYISFSHILNKLEDGRKEVAAHDA